MAAAFIQNIPHSLSNIPLTTTLSLAYRKVQLLMLLSTLILSYHQMSPPIICNTATQYKQFVESHCWLVNDFKFLPILILSAGLLNYLPLLMWKIFEGGLLERVIRMDNIKKYFQRNFASYQHTVYGRCLLLTELLCLILSSLDILLCVCYIDKEIFLNYIFRSTAH